MIGNLFIHTITALRFVKLGQSPLGSPSYGSQSYSFSSGSFPSVTEIPCRVEEYNAQTQYRTSDDRLVNATLIYLPPQFNLEEKDRVYAGTKHSADFSTGEFIGVIIGINPAFKASSLDLDHWEIIIENP